MAGAHRSRSGPRSATAGQAIVTRHVLMGAGRIAICWGGCIRQTARRMRWRLRLPELNVAPSQTIEAPALQGSVGGRNDVARRRAKTASSSPVNGSGSRRASTAWSVHEVLHVPRDHGVITETYPSGVGSHRHAGRARLSVASLPGAIGAWSCHAQEIDRLFVNQGQLKIVLYDDREESPTYRQIMELHVGDARPTFLVIPTGVWHGLQNLGSTEALMLNFPTRAYDYDRSGPLPVALGFTRDSLLVGADRFGACDRTRGLMGDRPQSGRGSGGREDSWWPPSALVPATSSMTEPAGTRLVWSAGCSDRRRGLL